jgi:hypothetical protein
MSASMLVVSGGSAWWLLRQTRHVPEFYSRATHQPPAVTAEASRRLRADVKQLQEDAAKVGSWRAEFSDDEVNAWLVEELPKKFPRLLARGASEPRVVIQDNRVFAAVRYRNRRIDTVISCEIQVALTEQPNMLALKVVGLKAGALPLPLSKFLKGISKEAAKGDIGVQWDLAKSGPIALVTIPSEHPDYVISPVTVESVDLADGRLTLAGHTGSLARQSYQPLGPVYRFVSFRHGVNRKDQRSGLSSKLR